MRALLIDAAAEVKIAELKERAFAMPIPRDINEGRARAFQDGGIRPRDWIENRIRIEQGFLVTFTVEDHKMGRVRHLEVGVEAKGLLPALEACEIFMKRFDFKNDFEGVLRWVDNKIGHTGMVSVHLIEPVDGDVDKFLRTEDRDPYAGKARA